MRPDESSDWQSQRAAPLENGFLDYGYVDEADYAMNLRGDLVVSWQQRDRTTKEWSTELRYAPAGSNLGAPKVLADEYCFIDHSSPCAGLSIASDGTATVAYGSTAGGDNMIVNVVRRAPDGTFTTPQEVSVPIWVNGYDGVHVAGNRRGDAVVSFAGGNHQEIWSQYARCPAHEACGATLRRGNDPSWLDSWVTTVGPKAGVTVTWSRYYHAGVLSRHLAP
jgi:hypothetical protein